MIGPSTRVEDDAFITVSVLGSSCSIGSSSTISGSYIWDNVHVGSGCEVVDSIVAAGARLENGVKLAKGCIVARDVVLGRGTELPPFTRVSKEMPEDGEDWEGREDGESILYPCLNWGLTLGNSQVGRRICCVGMAERQVPRERRCRVGGRRRGRYLH